MGLGLARPAVTPDVAVQVFIARDCTHQVPACGIPKYNRNHLGVRNLGWILLKQALLGSGALVKMGSGLARPVVTPDVAVLVSPAGGCT